MDESLNQIRVLAITKKIKMKPDNATNNQIIFRVTIIKYKITLVKWKQAAGHGKILTN